MREARDAGAAFHDACEAERAQAWHLRGEVDDLQGVVARNDALIADLQRDLAAARDEAVFACQRGDMPQANLAEAQAAWRKEGEDGRRTVEALEARLQEPLRTFRVDRRRAALVREKLDARDKAHTRLGKRARALIRAMRDLASRLEKAEQKAALAGERLNAEKSRFEDHRSQFEQSIRDLVEQLEKERAAGQVTAGALEPSRQQRSPQAPIKA